MTAAGVDSRTILLDLDGTLTDPGDGVLRCIAYALDELGLPVPPPERLRSWIGPPLQRSFAALFEELGCRVEIGLAVELYRRRFADTGLFENEVYPGIPGLLRELDAAGHKLLVATSKLEAFASTIVSLTGLDRWLDGVHGSDPEGQRVDKVDLLGHIIECESLDPNYCIMVGDREHDMLAARYHGMPAIGVLWGYGTEAELLEAGAEALVAEPRQLRHTLRNQ